MGLDSFDDVSDAAGIQLPSLPCIGIVRIQLYFQRAASLFNRIPVENSSIWDLFVFAFIHVCDKNFKVVPIWQVEAYYLAKSCVET
jgi:hypothetical protein